MGSEITRRIKRRSFHYLNSQLAHAPPSPVLDTKGKAEKREQRDNMKRSKPERPSPYTPGVAKK
jgi:hypothetical protein